LQRFFSKKMGIKGLEVIQVNGEPNVDVIKVSADGVITPIKTGHALLKISNGLASATYPVEVHEG